MSLSSPGSARTFGPLKGYPISVTTAVATVISGGINDRIFATKAMWLPTAAGLWLQWLALYMYGVFKTLGTFATGPLTLTNSGGGLYNFAPFTAVFQNPTTKKTYTNVDAISLAPSGTQTLNIQATQTGTASNSTPNTVTTLVTVMSGVACTNLGPVLGIDDQSDSSLQLECWNSIAANSPFGPAMSFAYAIQNALNSITSSPVNINRWIFSPSSHTGQVIVTLASPAGAADPNDVTGVATKIAAIARGMCIRVLCQSATPLSIADSITVYVTATPGLDTATVQLAIENALDAFLEGYPIGGQTVDGATYKLFASALDGACFSAFPGVFDVQGTTDHTMTGAQVATNNTSVAVVLV